MTDAEVVERACTGKKRYGTWEHASSDAAVLSRKTREAVRAYRCPFTDGTKADRHWHVGHVPTMAAVERIAHAIRGLDAA